MKSSFTALTLFVAVAVGQTLQINTPTNVVECEPTLFTWSGGTPPYFLSILPGNQPGAAALENLGQQTGTSFTWSSDIASGTSIGLTLRDSTGATAQSAAFTINAGSTTSCVGKGSSSSASGSGSSSSGPSSSGAASSPSSAAASTSPSAASPSATAPASSKAPTSSSSSSGGSSSSSSAPAPSSSNAAGSTLANMGVAGVVGAAAAALLL